MEHGVGSLVTTDCTSSRCDCFPGLGKWQPSRCSLRRSPRNLDIDGCDELPNCTEFCEMAGVQEASTRAGRLFRKARLQWRQRRLRAQVNSNRDKDFRPENAALRRLTILSGRARIPSPLETAELGQIFLLSSCRISSCAPFVSTGDTIPRGRRSGGSIASSNWKKQQFSIGDSTTKMRSLRGCASTTWRDHGAGSIEASSHFGRARSSQ